MTTDKRAAESVLASEVLAKRLKVTAIIESAEPMDTTDTVTAAGDAKAAVSDCVVGCPAPAFSVPAILADGSMSTLSLDQFKGQYLVLVFYPADFT
ncbi:hypothetical protein GGH95_003894, partial [Coemansia sp. RSA 1836]